MSYCDKSSDCKIIESLKAKMFDLQNEIEQLREALRKCNPWTVAKFNEYRIENYCILCNGIRGLGEEGNDKHADGCEYIKLTGGNDA